jgi:KDO2-lipid IV(A) lauroyltransferase
VASAIGGFLARKIGPLFPVQHVGQANLRAAFPDWSDAQIKACLHKVWDNLGRSMAEFPHMGKIFKNYVHKGDRSVVEIIGQEHVVAVKNGDRPGIFFSAHIGNWEIMPLAATSTGLKLHVVYRRPNNPLVNKLFISRGTVSGDLLPKGREGARAALNKLAAGEHVAMVMDQKMNDGLQSTLFGMPAMTAPAMVQLALKYGCPVIPACCVRHAGAKFTLELEDPIYFEKTGDNRADLQNGVQVMNAYIEKWIRRHPEQWLWFHRRWPKDIVDTRRPKA